MKCHQGLIVAYAVIAFLPLSLGEIGGHDTYFLYFLEKAGCWYPSEQRTLFLRRV
jgi:hypothetical protein